MITGVGVSLGVGVKVGLGVLVGVGTGARAISELAEQPKEMAIAAKGRINKRSDFVCTKRNLLMMIGSTRAIIPYYARKTKKAPYSEDSPQTDRRVILRSEATKNLVLWGKDFTKVYGYAMI